MSEQNRNNKNIQVFLHQNYIAHSSPTTFHEIQHQLKNLHRKAKLLINLKENQKQRTYFIFFFKLGFFF